MKRTTLTSIALASGLFVTLSAASAHAEGCGDLLIVLDRSGSMAGCKVGGKLKESLAKTAIANIVKKFPTVPMGLMVFPDTLTACVSGQGCTVGKMVVDVTDDGASKVVSFVNSMPKSCGGTPTGTTMEVARDYSKWASGRDHYVLLITDGQPTCTDGVDGATRSGDTCTPGGPTVPCDGGGLCECKNPTRVYEAIKALNMKGIHTFVIGFEGMGEAIDPMGMACGPDPSHPFNPDALNKMAEEGGEAQQPPAATKYYSAVDEATLNAAFDKILGKVAGGTVGGCVKGGSGGSGSGGGGGSGGSGGAGGAGGSGDAGGSGGQGGDPGDQPDGGRRAGGSPGVLPGCGCHTSGSGSVGATVGLLLGALFALARSRRRR